MKLHVILYSADWCKWCKVVEPIFEQLKVEYPNVEFVKHNADECTKEQCDELGLKSLPTMYFYVPGDIDPVASLGVVAKPVYVAMIESLLVEE